MTHCVTFSIDRDQTMYSGGATMEALIRMMALSDDDLDKLVTENPSIFRRVTLKDGRRGLAKLVP